MTRGPVIDFAGSPSHVMTLVERYGAERVYRVGMSTIGYPPTWEISLDESLAIAAAIRNGA